MFYFNLRKKLKQVIFFIIIKKNNPNNQQTKTNKLLNTFLHSCFESTCYIENLKNYCQNFFGNIFFLWSNSRSQSACSPGWGRHSRALFTWAAGWHGACWGVCYREWAVVSHDSSSQLQEENLCHPKFHQKLKIYHRGFFLQIIKYK